jgi:hypothetical protein
LVALQMPATDLARTGAFRHDQAKAKLKAKSD